MRTRALLVTGIVGALLLAGCATEPPRALDEARPTASPAAPTRTVTTDGEEVRTLDRPPPWVTRTRAPRAAYVSVAVLGLRGVPVRRTHGGSGPGSGSGSGVLGLVVTGRCPGAVAPDRLGRLVDGARVEVRTGEQVATYRVTGTPRTPRSTVALRGGPGVRPGRAVLTLAACATP